jgi:hypothetical protein
MKSKTTSRRNTLIHSQYLFQFTEIGLPPIMSHRQRLDGEPKFIRQILDKDAQQKLLNDLAKLVIDINFTLVQFIHDYEAPFVPNSPASRQRPVTEPFEESQARSSRFRPVAFQISKIAGRQDGLSPVKPSATALASCTSTLVTNPISAPKRLLQRCGDPP